MSDENQPSGFFRVLFMPQHLLDKSRALDFLAPLLLRLYLIPVFWMAGANKLNNKEGVVAWFGTPISSGGVGIPDLMVPGLSMPLPELMFYLAAYTEFAGAALLAIGLAVRWIALPLMVTMLVAAFTVHWPPAYWENGDTFKVEEIYKVDGTKSAQLATGEPGQIVLGGWPFRAGTIDEEPSLEDRLFGRVSGYYGDTGIVRVDGENPALFEVHSVKAREGEWNVLQGELVSGSIGVGDTVTAGITKSWKERWNSIAESPMRSAENLDRFKNFLRSEYAGRYNWVTERGSIVVLNNGIEFAITYFVMLLALFFWGGGRYFSIDYWLGQLFGYRPANHGEFMSHQD